jgi:hypothetical protein
VVASDDRRGRRRLEIPFVEVLSTRDAVDVLVLIHRGWTYGGEGLAFALRELGLSLHGLRAKVPPSSEETHDKKEGEGRRRRGNGLDPPALQP